MKKKFNIIIITILCLFFVGCKVDNQQAPHYSIDLSGLNEELYPSTFELDMLKIVVSRNGEDTEIINVNESMLSVSDLELLETPGQHTVKIIYKTFQVDVVINLLVEKEIIDNDNDKEVYSYYIDTTQLPDELYPSTFNLSDIRIKSVSSKGVVDFINVDESMISADDILKLNTHGNHTITIQYQEQSFEIMIILLEEISTNVFESLNSYYYNANGKNGNELKIALRGIISSNIKHVETYGELRYDIPLSDADPNIKGNIILLYTGLSVPATWDGGNTWNREHVWPQSLGWFSTSDAGADLHHIRPTNPSENSSRGNKKYGTSTSSGYYEPRDEVKGDVARIIFYLMVRYQEADNYTFKSVAESKELLLEWNTMDPVDAFEMNRNEVAYSIQGNRNPFIDHPECAELIWLDN